MGESELYETDFIGWTEQQGRLLREIAARPGNDRLDWSNIAEEIESLGRSQYRGLLSQVQRVIVHLLKLQFSPAQHPRAGWMDTIDDGRREIATYMISDPGLAARMIEIVATANRLARIETERALRRYEEADAASRVREHVDFYTESQVVQDWFPDATH